MACECDFRPFDFCRVHDSVPPAGYHTREIARGKFGEFSKIREELEELEDAEIQGSVVMIGVELSDLYGAIREYARQHHLSMDDLAIMANITQRAFQSGYRKPR